ncbi:MAG TPA: hypothetical protein VMR95_03275 [Candidatus Binatia bacterium]|nr:hypothetical protein [Candidatus Binatia bacterium]
MSEVNLAETVRTLDLMQRNLSSVALAELRGNSENTRTRIERLTKTWPHGNTTSGYEVVSSSGNSTLLVDGRHGPTEMVARNISAHYLWFLGKDLPRLVIYPFGIVNVTDKKLPVFEVPGVMRSIALEYKPDEHTNAWLQNPVEPLFNVTDSGTVLSRFYDQATPRELQLVNDILDEFESAARAR